MFQRFMLAWDGSEVARRALDVAIDLTRRFGGELTAVSIAYSPAHAETEADRAESARAAKRFLEDSFGAVRDRAERAGVHVEHVVLEGDSPAGVLIDHAHQHGFDLIVCGQHRRGRTGRLLLHEVPEQLVADVSVPILVVGEPDV
jgi:nucleotide-binding universal stress UspA family protein